MVSAGSATVASSVWKRPRDHFHHASESSPVLEEGRRGNVTLAEYVTDATNMTNFDEVPLDPDFGPDYHKPAFFMPYTDQAFDAEVKASFY